MSVKTKSKNTLNSAFTLIELVVVVVIVGVLVSLGVPLYMRTVERARDYEAKTNLLLIHAAQLIYRAENNFYYPPGSTTSNLSDINNYLHLNLNDNLWTYSITGTLTTFVAQALRNGGGFNRLYNMSETLDEATCVGTCP